MASSGNLLKSGDEAHPEKKMKRTVKKNFTAYYTKFRLLLQVCMLLQSGISEAASQAVGLYAGPGVPTPLADLVRVRQMSLESDFILSAVYSRALWQRTGSVGLEAEAHLNKHLEHATRFSIDGALLVRVLQTPWQKALNGTFAVGNGLSWASSVPAMESRNLPRSSRLLYHLIFEFSVPVSGHSGQSRGYEGALRLHHRSGAFGLFDKTVGGSDYLCLGLRYRI